MKRKFSDLKPGDKVFEIFDTSTVGIYEIKEIVIGNSFIRIKVNTIIGINRGQISFSYKGIEDCFHFHSCIYDSEVYCNEEDFVEALKKYENI